MCVSWRYKVRYQTYAFPLLIDNDIFGVKLTTNFEMYRGEVRMRLKLNHAYTDAWNISVNIGYSITAI